MPYSMVLLKDHTITQGVSAMRQTIIAISIAFIAGALWAADQAAVDVHGALKNIMHEGDLSAQADLMIFDATPHIYALGAVAELKGEIIVVDSRPYVSSVQAESLRVVNTLNSKAVLLVSSQVESWTSYPIPSDVTSYEELEALVPTLATKQGIDTALAFPFMLGGRPEKVDWHVIDWPEGDTVHTHDKHKDSGLSGTLEDVEVTIVGFYSSKHHAIFTHHTTNMHMHVINEDHTIAGHVDDLKLAPGVKLWLPE
jgi:acetolactate decarboxylase